MVGLRAKDVQKVAQHGAGLLFQGAVRKIYQSLTGDEPKGDTVRLLERLFADDRLTPEATLYLVSIARALGEAGRRQADHLGLPPAFREQVASIGHRFAQQIVHVATRRV